MHAVPRTDCNACPHRTFQARAVLLLAAPTMRQALVGASVSALVFIVIILYDVHLVLFGRKRTVLMEGAAVSPAVSAARRVAIATPRHDGNAGVAGDRSPFGLPPPSSEAEAPALDVRNAAGPDGLVLAPFTRAHVTGWKTARQTPHTGKDLMTNILHGVTWDNRFLVAFGAHIVQTDGSHDVVTWAMLTDPLVRGLAFDEEAEAIAKYDSSRIGKISGLTDPQRALVSLREGGTPRDPLVLKVDIDSFDLDLIEAVLRDGYRPLFVTYEINEKVPPPIRFCMHWGPAFWGGKAGQPIRRGHIYGTSFQSSVDVLDRYGYTFLMIGDGDGANDAYWARNDVADAIAAVAGVKWPHPLCSFKDNYLSQVTGKSKNVFPWNNDVRAWADDSKDVRERVRLIRAYVDSVAAGDDASHIELWAPVEAWRPCATYRAVCGGNENVPGCV